jgi:hypothetical protein
MNDMVFCQKIVYRQKKIDVRDITVLSFNSGLILMGSKKSQPGSIHFEIFDLIAVTSKKTFRLPLVLDVRYTFKKDIFSTVTF